MNNLDCKNNKISEVNASNLENKARFKAFTLLFFFIVRGFQNGGTNGSITISPPRTPPPPRRTAAGRR